MSEQPVTEAGRALHDLLHDSKWRNHDICAEAGCDILAGAVAIEREAAEAARADSLRLAMAIDRVDDGAARAELAEPGDGHDHDCTCRQPGSTHRHEFRHAHEVEHVHRHEHPTDGMVVRRLDALREDEG